MSSRSTLKMRAVATSDDIVALAVRQKLCLSATYNRNLIRLAPHALYTKHGEYYVDGVVLERDGQPPRELKLGSFKLIGLKGLALAPTRFDPDPVFDPKAERYGEDALLVEPA